MKLSQQSLRRATEKYQTIRKNQKQSATAQTKITKLYMSEFMFIGLFIFSEKGKIKFST